MTLTARLRRRHREPWERMVMHPFVRDMGNDSLTQEQARRYFLQDHVFFRSLVTLLALGIAKAPALAQAKPLDAFLHSLLTGEEDFFQRAFDHLRIPQRQRHAIRPLPTAHAFASYFTVVAYSGAFEELLTCLLVTEGTYADWSRRLVKAGKRPADPLWREWTDIHAGRELASFVREVETMLNATSVTPSQERNLDEVFKRCLGYEHAFWEMAYKGETW